MDLGMENIAAHEQRFAIMPVSGCTGLNWLTVQGDAPDKDAIFP